MSSSGRVGGDEDVPEIIVDRMCSLLKRGLILSHLISNRPEFIILFTEKHTFHPGTGKSGQGFRGVGQRFFDALHIIL
jgi:hypothetical protein